MRTTNIYALRDPRTDVVRYVGRSDDPSRRLGDHLADARRSSSSSLKVAWLRELMGLGMLPRVEVLETTPIAEEASREAHWMAQFEGLLNIGSAQGSRRLEHPSRQWGIRVPLALAGRVKEHLEELRKRQPNATRSDAVLALVAAGLEATKPAAPTAGARGKRKG